MRQPTSLFAPSQVDDRSMIDSRQGGPAAAAATECGSIFTPCQRKHLQTNDIKLGMDVLCIVGSLVWGLEFKLDR